MGCPCEVLIETDDESCAHRLTEQVAAGAWRVEKKWSRYLHGNLVDRINHGERVTLDDETVRLVQFADELFRLSDGAFDITSGVLREAWEFDGSDRVPDASQVEEIMQHVGWHRVYWEPPALQLAPGMQLDFGGIGKEYAVDLCSAELMRTTEFSCVVNFGGDLCVTRPPVGIDGWRVGIESIQRSSEADGLLTVRRGALATSGRSHRFLLKDGVRYGHILDARTGWPVPDAPRSVTVAADNCTMAGMFATLASLEGAGAERFLESEGVSCWIKR